MIAANKYTVSQKLRHQIVVRIVCPMQCSSSGQNIKSLGDVSVRCVVSVVCGQDCDLTKFGTPFPLKIPKWAWWVSRDQSLLPSVISAPLSYRAFKQRAITATVALSLILSKNAPVETHRRCCLLLSVEFT